MGPRERHGGHVCPLECAVRFHKKESRLGKLRGFLNADARLTSAARNIQVPPSRLVDWQTIRKINVFQSPVGAGLLGAIARIGTGTDTITPRLRNSSIMPSSSVR